MTLKTRIIGTVFIFLFVFSTFVWFSLQQEPILDAAAQQKILSERVKLDMKIPELKKEIADTREQLGLKTTR